MIFSAEGQHRKGRGRHGLTSRQARCTSLMIQPELVSTCCFRSRQLSSSVANRILPSAEHTSVSPVPQSPVLTPGTRGQPSTPESMPIPDTRLLFSFFEGIHHLKDSLAQGLLCPGEPRGSYTCQLPSQ